MESGIYIITCLINEKVYVGYTTNFKSRFNKHKKSLNNKTHHNNYLQKSWNKYGESNFLFEILEEYPNEGFILPSMENWWCNILQAHNPKYGYNLQPTHPYKKVLFSPITKEKISKSNKGRIVSEETKNKISNTLMGHIGNFKKGMHTKESLLKISNGNKGKKRSKTHIESVRKAHLGSKASEETKAKMRASSKHIKQSKEHYIKIARIKSKAILQYDLEMNFIKEWNKVTDAIKFYGGDIPAVLNKRQKTSCGFIWKYKNEIWII